MITTTRLGTWLITTTRIVTWLITTTRIDTLLITITRTGTWLIATTRIGKWLITTTRIGAWLITTTRIVADYNKNRNMGTILEIWTLNRANGCLKRILKQHHTNSYLKLNICAETFHYFMKKLGEQNIHPCDKIKH